MSDYRSLIGQLLVGPGDDPNMVFQYYNPYLLSFPMRIMLKSKNSEQLRMAGEEFVKDKAVYRSLVVGDMLYVEYLPQSLSHVGFGDKYSQIVAYCRRHNISIPSNIAKAFNRSKHASLL